MYNDLQYLNIINPFMLPVSFYNPWKHLKPSGILMFSGGIEKPLVCNGLMRITQIHQIEEAINDLPYNLKLMGKGGVKRAASKRMQSTPKLL